MGDQSKLRATDASNALTLGTYESGPVSIYPIPGGRVSMFLPNGTTVNFDAPAIRKIYRWLGAWLEAESDVE